MSFSDMTDGRRVMLVWMSNWDYPFAFPTTHWKGESTPNGKASAALSAYYMRIMFIREIDSWL
nr:hypothetical protein [Paenibacillus donghaensis]